MLEATNYRNVDAAIARLRSLHDGDMGVVDTIACGAEAIPELKAILFAREPSGVYETRRHAVEALAGLHALDVLRLFLGTPREIPDPVERTGEDAVINAAARALGQAPDTRDLPLLFSLVRDRPLAGVIETLGKFRAPGALPYFIAALGDDFLRPSAEESINRLGSRAIRQLVYAALDRDPLIERESSSSTARRRAALRLLEGFSVAREALPPAFFRLADDDDPWVALRATRLALPHITTAQSAHAVSGLIRHLKSPDDLLAREIEDVLVAHYDLIAPAIEQAAAQPHHTVPIWRTTDHTYQTLSRVKARTTNILREASHDG